MIFPLINAMIDLHTHSTASDGTLTPSELALAAKKAGLKACAITDHDTVDGVGEFLNACRLNGVEGIPGVELSAKYHSELHIVGLYIDYENKNFLDNLYKLKNARRLRNINMLKKCCDMGFNITENDLLSQNENSTMDSIGRPHFAAAFVKHGYTKILQEAFDLYIDKGKPCYVERELYTPEKCVRMIKNAGGIAVLAHPISVSRDRETLYELLKELKGYGLDGAECFYSAYDDEFTILINGICRELGLKASGGSDFHGLNSPELRLGKGKGNLNIPYSILLKMTEDMPWRKN